MIHIRSHEVTHNAKQCHVQCTKSQKVKNNRLYQFKQQTYASSIYEIVNC